MALLALEAATLGYGKTPVLEKVGLAIRPGEFWILEGPNGEGKSTLLKSLAGIVPLLAGARRAEGIRLGYVPQQADTTPALPFTALEMVELGAAAQAGPCRGFSGVERRFHRECLGRCEAEGLARRRFDRLSGGQRQRVLLARALAVRPNTLCLDEPFAGVDPATEALLASRLAQMSREEGLAITLITHKPELFDALGIPHRKARVQGGRLSFLQ